MTLPKYYNTGTASVANGATAVTGSGTAWRGVAKADDYFTAQGLSVRIASVESNTAVTLAEAWPGTSLTSDPYEIAVNFDGPEFQLQLRQLIEDMNVVEANGRGTFYLFSTTTTDADPGPGYLRLNHATPASVTAAYLDNLDANGADNSSDIDTWDDSTSTVRGRLYIRSIDDRTKLQVHNVTGSVVNGTGYRKLTLSGGFGTAFSADEQLMAFFAPKGDLGSSGANGTNGGLFVVRVAATANVTIASALENGDTLDGVTLATGDAVLLTGQTTTHENGVYTVVASGAASRHASYSSYNAIAGQLFNVSEGTANADTLWRCTSNAGGTLGSTAIAISKVGAFETIGVYAPSSVAALDITNLSQYRALRLTGLLIPATNANALHLRTSTDNGSSFAAGGSDYANQFVYASAATTVAAASNSTDKFQLQVTNIYNDGTTGGVWFNALLFDFNQSKECKMIANVAAMDSGGTGLMLGGLVMSRRISSTARNALRLVFNSGNIASGQVTLEGVRG